jgi:hypothetical protein
MCHNGNFPIDSKVCKGGAVVTVHHAHVPRTVSYLFSMACAPLSGRNKRNNQWGKNINDLSGHSLPDINYLSTQWHTCTARPTRNIPLQEIGKIIGCGRESTPAIPDLIIVKAHGWID